MLVKKGDLKIHKEQLCREKLFECAECGKQMKRDIFRLHISREHQDTMLNKFSKQNQEPQSARLNRDQNDDY